MKLKKKMFINVSCLYLLLLFQSSELKLINWRSWMWTREAFTHGLQSACRQQCLLENVTLDLQTALDQVRAVDVAQKQSESDGPPVFPINAATGGT